MLDAVPLPIQAALSHQLTRADTSILDVDWVNSPALGPSCWRRSAGVYLPTLNADH